ncbi:MAG: OsmC family peroxiredoxin [Thermoplasmata archaeon]
MKSTAEAVWEHDLLKGSGQVQLKSGAAPALPVSWSSRTEASNGKTSPEELLAAAHAACYSMAFSAGLARNGTPADRLTVQAVATFDKVGEAWRVTTMELSVTGVVPKLIKEKFEELAWAAKEGCPISNAIKGNVEIRLTTHLAGSPS